MLSSFHKFILIFNIDFLNSIINVLDFDIELLFSLSFALMFAKLEEEKCMKRLFIFLFIENILSFEL